MFDNGPYGNAATLVAAAVINPVTFHKWKPVQHYDKYRSVFLAKYHALEALLQERFITTIDAFIIHSDPVRREVFSTTGNHFCSPLSHAENEELNHFFEIPFGSGKIIPVYLVNNATLIDKWTTFLKAHDLLTNEFFPVMEQLILRKATVIDC